MFLKIRTQHEGGRGIHSASSVGNTIPYRDRIFECKKVEIRKHRVVNCEEYDEICNNLYKFHYPIEVIGPLVEDKEIEFLEIFCDSDLILAIDSVAFLMNNSGKTIETYTCYNYV